MWWWWCGGRSTSMYVFVLMVISSRALLLKISTPLLSFFAWLFVLFIRFNVYIIVFYGCAFLVEKFHRPISFRALSLCSGEITCVSYFQQFHFCWNLLNPLKKNGGICWAWRDKNFGLFFSFRSYWKCCIGFALKYYEPNITITTHYPRSYKTNEMAMTKWLLCGVDLFSRPGCRWNNFIYSVLLPSLHTDPKSVS